MNRTQDVPPRVGEVRPSQLMFTYGVGAIVDLPKLSVIVTGLDDWPTGRQYVKPIVEDRLLVAVRFRLNEVTELRSLPASPEVESAQDEGWVIGVPVATFPRWMLCPRCRLLAPLHSGLFELEKNERHPDRTVYRHGNCNKGQRPEVVPARFLIACEEGHLDDFPWVSFVHKGEPCDRPRLELVEYGPSGEARDLEVRCRCGKTRRLSMAFSKDYTPTCTARRPHLRDYDPEGCEREARTLLLGASNTWFPVVLSTVAIPVEGGRLAQLVEENWATLQNVTSPEVLQAFRNAGMVGGELAKHDDGAIWETIQARRQADAGEGGAPDKLPDLKAPEWQVLTHFKQDLNGDDFRLRPIKLPAGSPYRALIPHVMLVERLREVRAMIGFTRVDAVGELTDPDLGRQIEPAPLSRERTRWVPANEVRGEGIFLRFDEAAMQAWEARAEVKARAVAFWQVHRQWREARYIENPDAGFPGMRYILLHSFSHALMREMALECGYSAAGIRERLYARLPDMEGGPMAGVLIYTSAPDSEGTLGGLVSLGEPATLNRLIAQALEAMQLCAGDPLCAERPPTQDGRTLHASACHACLFAPETSCERGNKYLDRATLAPTLAHDALAFFEKV